MPDRLQLTVTEVTDMSKAGFLEAHLCDLEFGLSSNNYRICEDESQIVSFSSEVAMEAENLSSTERCIRLAGDEVMVMLEQGQGHEPESSKIQAEHSTEEYAHTMVKCTVLLLAVSESALCGNVNLL